MKTFKPLAVAAMAAISLTGSAFAAPVIFMYGGGGHTLQEFIAPRYENNTHFGSVTTAAGSKSKSYVIRNNGDAELVVNSVNITGTGAGSFSIALGPLANIPPNGFSNFSIDFDPTSNGLHSATVTVGTNAPANSLFEFNIAGIGADSVPPKPDFDAGIITLVKSKKIEKDGVTYLKATYIVPISNLGDFESAKKVATMKVLSSVDRFLDDGDISAQKILKIKKALDPADTYQMKVKVKLELPPGTSRIIFQIESPDDYETRYNNNLRFETVPAG